MRWKPLAALLLLCAIPAAADEKGDALIKGWTTRIPGLLPVAAEWTITYRVGKLSASYRHNATLTPTGSRPGAGPYRFDLDFPMELYQDPMAANLDPLPDPNSAAVRLGVASAPRPDS